MSQIKMISIDNAFAINLRTHLLGAEHLYIYGAGAVGQEAIRTLQAAGGKVRGVIDKKVQTKIPQGVPLIKADEVTLRPEQRRNALIVLCIFNPHVDTITLQKNLYQEGWGEVISFTEFHAAFASEMGDRFWLTDRAHYKNHAPAIRAASTLWSDRESLKLYEDTINSRCSGKQSTLPEPSLDDQYCPRGISLWPDNIRLIDCGAYDGDTLKMFKKRSAKLEAIAAFEPDQKNFENLSRYVRSEGESLSSSISLFPCGVAATNSQLRFSSGKGTASHFSESGEDVMQCVALDDVLPVYRPNLIQMDIEGGEYAALLGGKKLIQNNRPALAISVYHVAEDLWRIPLLVEDWMGNGTHHLRLHAYNGFELIYYYLPAANIKRN